MWTMNFQVFKWISKRQRKQRPNCKHLLDHQKSKRVPEKPLFLLYWLCQSSWLCGLQQTGKFLRRWEYQTTLPVFLRNLYAGQQETIRTGHGTTNWCQIGKGVRQGSMLSPCLFNLHAGYIMWNAGWMKHRLESRLPGEIAITLDMQMKPLLWQKVKSNWRASWWKWKRSKKAGLKLNIQKMKIMARSHHFIANRWGNDGNHGRLYFLGLQNHCKWWLQAWN